MRGFHASVKFTQHLQRNELRAPFAVPDRLTFFRISFEPESVNAWMEQLSDFARPMVERIYKCIRKAAPQLEVGIRWNSPAFMGRSLVCSFSAFRKHVALIFWRGAELNDLTGLLTHGQGRSSMRSAKFTDVNQIDEKLIRAWVTAAVALDKDPAKPKPKLQKRPEAAVPKILAAALSKNPKVRAAFEAMPPSHRR
jgi:hypothetical protein